MQNMTNIQDQIEFTMRELVVLGKDMLLIFFTIVFWYNDYNKS